SAPSDPRRPGARRLLVAQRSRESLDAAAARTAPGRRPQPRRSAPLEAAPPAAARRVPGAPDLRDRSLDIPREAGAPRDPGFALGRRARALVEDPHARSFLSGRRDPCSAKLNDRRSRDLG